MTLTVETWIEALESGRYKQAQEYLRDSNLGFCCLGVACDLSGRGEWQAGTDYYVIADPSETVCTALPYSVQATLGLNTEDGAFDAEALPRELWLEIIAIATDAFKPSTLAGLNDSGVPFPLIAKVIRARPKGLFREDAAS